MKSNPFLKKKSLFIVGEFTCLLLEENGDYWKTVTLKIVYHFKFIYLLQNIVQTRSYICMYIKNTCMQPNTILLEVNYWGTYANLIFLYIMT